MSEFVPPPPVSRLLWAGIDLDGTLAESVWSPENPSSDIGSPIRENIDKLRALRDAGYKIIIHTSRAWEQYAQVEAWLIFHRIPFKEIQMGKALFAVYIDDRGLNASAESWLPENLRGESE